jgi:hypothetical protein
MANYIEIKHRGFINLDWIAFIEFIPEGIKFIHFNNEEIIAKESDYSQDAWKRLNEKIRRVVL